MIIKRILFAFIAALFSFPVLAQTLSVSMTPIMGWSSWNTYRIHINQQLIEKQAKAMVDLGLKDVGYNYVNIDDGFFGYRDDKGNMIPNTIRFPNGLAPVVDSIHKLGLYAGIYSDAGRNTCGSIWDKDPNGIGVGLYGHEAQDAALYFNKLGFDFIKIDYCGAGQELNLDVEKRYTTICDSINKVATHPIRINICRWTFPGTWVTKIADSWRISNDITPKWWSIKYIIGKNLYLSAYASKGHYNDMDMLEIGRGLPLNEEEVHMGMWCIMSSPLLIGCDLTKIPDSSLQLLKNKELIALDQDPLGRQAEVVMHDGKTYVLAKDLLVDRGRERAVALYNPTDTVAYFDVPLQALDYQSGKEVRVRDLIHHKNMPPIIDSLRANLPARSVMMLRLKGCRTVEPTKYEAETAYLPNYNDLPKVPKLKYISYVPDSLASGQMIVRYGGGSSDNTIDFTRVYSAEGGQYTLLIAYRPDPLRGLQVWVNGSMVASKDLTYDKHQKQFKTYTCKVTLHQGYNVVSLASPYSWLPDIDYISLKKE